MHFLIDGHNLLAKMTSIELGVLSSEAELTLLLRRWAASRKNRRATVIFDGGLPGGQDRLLSTSSVSVIFAARDRTADDLLIARIRKVRNPTELTVVSDDGQVRDAAQVKKAIWISAAAFAPMLDNLGRPPASGMPADESSMSPEELDEWLELFNGGADSR